MGLGTTSVLVLLLALLIIYLPGLLRTPLPPHVTGFVAEGWEGVEEVFRRHVESGIQKGATFSVYHKGSLVVDLAGGYADDEAEWPMRADSLFALASTVKALGAICLALLVDKGLISYEKPVAHYWPEFAQNGKDKITVDQFLSHQGGLAVIEEKFDFFDSKMDDVLASIASQPPNWPPGTGHGYHTYALVSVMDKLIRLTDTKQRDMGQFFTEEIGAKFVCTDKNVNDCPGWSKRGECAANPAWMEVNCAKSCGKCSGGSGLDIYFGLPDSVAVRAARNYPADMVGMELLSGSQYWRCVWAFLTDKSSMTHRAMMNPEKMIGAPLNNPDVRRHHTAGFASAKSVAHLMGTLANGADKDGRTVLSPEAVRRLGRPLTSGEDKVVLQNVTYGPGVTLRETPSGGWNVGAPGAGGQMGYFDANAKLGWGYLRNHWSLYSLGDEPYYLELEKAMYEIVSRL